jgi:hypothetical protein
MKTVAIKPVLAFANGVRMIATQFNVTSVKDNLFDFVVFEYTLFDEANQWAGASTFTLATLEEYQTWFATPEGAFEIVAAGIGLEIIKPEGEDKTVFLEIM